jgi:hypothetical protein
MYTCPPTPTKKTWQKPKRLQEKFWPDFSGEDVNIIAEYSYMAEQIKGIE